MQTFENGHSPLIHVASDQGLPNTVISAMRYGVSHMKEPYIVPYALISKNRNVMQNRNTIGMIPRMMLESTFVRLIGIGYDPDWNGIPVVSHHCRLRISRDEMEHQEILIRRVSVIVFLSTVGGYTLTCNPSALNPPVSIFPRSVLPARTVPSQASTP
jgi:hypothetical protein